MDIKIIDCGVGNLRSVQRACLHLGYSSIITNDPKELKQARCIILPGQGSFFEMKENLEKYNLRTPICEHIHQKKPFLGICVGFQILFDYSFEHGTHRGLGIFPGEIVPLDATHVKVPHMGWNQLKTIHDPLKILSNLPSKYMYFANSFVLRKTDTHIVSTVTDYDDSFVSMIQTTNLLATQFHPEKSGREGLLLLDMFFKTVL